MPRRAATLLPAAAASACARARVDSARAALDAALQLADAILRDLAAARAELDDSAVYHSCGAAGAGRDALDSAAPWPWPDVDATDDGAASAAPDGGSSSALDARELASPARARSRLVAPPLGAAPSPTAHERLTETLRLLEGAVRRSAALGARAATE